jgi:tetratricopeptide (TPR) repeat protein
MGKKSRARRERRAAGSLGSPQVEAQLTIATNLLAAQKYESTIGACQRILHLPSLAPSQRAEALGYLGVAQAMLQNYYDAYDAFTQALALDPDNAQLLYNRGQTARFAGRIGQSARDLERAVELERDGEMAERYAEELAFSRKIAEQSRALRGPDFTLDQLLEQEELFQQATDLVGKQRYTQAEPLFRKVIDMGDCLPQPWGNLGLCLIARGRYDEAEVALNRALELDPDYAHARNNLAALAEIRRTGKPIIGSISEPFKHANVKQSLTFTS